MPEPSCPGLASAAVLKGPQTGGFGVRKLSDPLLSPRVPPATFLPPSPNDKYGRGSALAKPHALIRSDVARASESCLLSRALPRARALKIAK